jgi:hypothetical protein
VVKKVEISEAVLKQFHKENQRNIWKVNVDTPTLCTLSIAPPLMPFRRKWANVTDDRRKIPAPIAELQNFRNDDVGGMLGPRPDVAF